MTHTQIIPSFPEPAPGSASARILRGQSVASLAQALVLPLRGTGSAASMPSGCNVQLLPDGVFSSTDGRPGNLQDCSCAAWKLDQKAADTLIRSLAERETPLVVDYEHQTIAAKTNGHPAPAAGFFSSLTYVPGQGLFTCVSWTERARQHIADGEYLYISPVFTFCRTTGAITGLLHAALTNTPALDGMAAVAAALIFPPGTTPNIDLEDHRMDNLLEQLRLLLNVPEPAAMEDLTAILEEMYLLLKEHGKDDVPVDLPAFVKEKLQPKSNAETGETVVSLDTLTGMQHEIAALTVKMASLQSGHATQTANNAIAAALSDGRLPKSLESWAKDLSCSNPHVLASFLEKAKPIAALTTMQTAALQQNRQHSYACDPTSMLSEEEAYAAEQLGMTPQEFTHCKQKGGQ